MRPNTLLDVDPDIRKAHTLPSSVFGDPETYGHILSRVFEKTWHVVAPLGSIADPERALPVTLLEGSLDEPLVLTRDAGGALACLSNVCTHRGSLVVSSACPAASLRCRYHGRRFGLDGRFAGAAGFEGAEGFPSPSDDLPRVPLATFGPLAFASLDPAMSFDALVSPIAERLAFAGLERARLDPASSRDYEVDASFALYCDNYLEGFHIPYVHRGLSGALDVGAYATETFPWGSVQIGIAREGEPTLDLPEGHPDAGRKIAAYYAWLFPATMLNVYPWGVSVNVVRPLGPTRTRVTFLSFVTHPEKRGRGAGADLHEVELEDEAIVASVQRGVRSRLYRRGRFSPTCEIGVHHFHRLLADML